MNYSNNDCRLRAAAPKPNRVARRKTETKRGAAKNRTAAKAAVVATIFSTLTLGAQAQFVIQPNEAQSKDAKAYGFFPDMNFQSNLGVVGSGAEEHAFKSAIQFDLTAIPIPSGEITLATLELYCSAVTPFNDSGTPPQPIPGTGLGNVSLFQITSAWTELGLTWNNFPTLAPTAIDTELVDTAGRWYSFDVTPMVQAWQSGSAVNHGFGIIMESEFGQVVFLDGDGLQGANPDPTLAPRLTVVPEPGSAMLTLCGLGFLLRRRRTTQA